MNVKLLSLAAGLAAVASAHAAPIADLATDFSIGSNPNGNWSYGYSTFANAAVFSLYDTNAQVTATYGANTAEGWSSTSSPTGVYPYVAQNVSNWVYGGTVSFTAGTMIMHPGNASSHLFSVSRYTVGPTSLGTVRLDAMFQRLESNGTSTYGIFKNGVLLAGWGGTLTGTGAAFGPSSSLVSLSAGDTLDIIVGPGTDSYGGDVNLVSASLSTVPGPGAAIAFGIAALARRRRRSV